MFPCVKCGLCCKQSWVPAEMRNEKGYCKHLTDDNLCGIYINRPADCNLSIVRAKLNMSERIFNKAHLYDCMVLAEQEELPEVVEQIRQELIKL